MRVDIGCIDGLRKAKGSLQDEDKRTMLTDYSSQWNDAGSTIVAGLLQVRPKGATQVAPALLCLLSKS
ncbi:hypothetical protein C9J48_24910 [Photobacterium profundum]|uniref:Uncharacterized protein n=1 Tax=Photobacterium profundum 3TCK TaxID=314280 RepID=Q1Z088_9GAMM|nr:hypothetical protein P3TCK_25385 [Photobacterium profundum 3TCK]PSV59170.1 hypothetical protein C9J48_24910 [Photobacterium profundum]